MHACIRVQRIVATNKFVETCLATPAISAGSLSFRPRDKLVAVGSTAR